MRVARLDHCFTYGGLRMDVLYTLKPISRAFLLKDPLFLGTTNIVSIPLYFVKGYGFTGIQYSIFLILAIYGYLAWKKNLDSKKQIS